MTTKLTHHHLSAEAVNDKHGPAILLTQQDGIEEPQSVLVHPWQLRAVCEQFGIIASDSQAAKTIATLQRRMVGLRDRIDDLADWMGVPAGAGYTAIALAPGIRGTAFTGS